MDKRILQTYSAWAKDNLEQQIEVTLKTLGINSDSDIKSARKVGDVTIIEGDQASYSGALYSKREQIVNLVKNNGYQNVIEEFAYTWFNRFISLRFMEVHNFLPHGFRVLSNKTGDIEPEILKNLPFVRDELKLDINYCSKLREHGKIEDLFRYVLLQQCKALSGILPMLFAENLDYLELLVPKTLLRGETALTRLLEIPEKAFLEDVEIIGWLYQFYISDKKDQVNKDKETITKDTLPAVTQLFTPDWIVRYMAENSVGRIWLESYPDSILRSEMKYYVDDAEQIEEVKKQIYEIKYKNVNPEEIKIIEPCCGSGHILVYIFDLLYKMYEEKGYNAREIPTLILKNNLYGLDVDKRAAQLSSFALIMKARTINNRFFNPRYYEVPKVYEILDSSYLDGMSYRKQLSDLNLLSKEEINEIEKLITQFKYGKTIGSLLKIKPFDYEGINKSLATIDTQAITTVFNHEFLGEGVEYIRRINEIAKVLSDKYDVMITNPPYLGIAVLEDSVREYAFKHYPDSKTDMYAMFMETPFVKHFGFRSMINQQSWMYLVSFKELREKILKNSVINTIIHLGSNAFEDITGQVVQNCTFVIRNIKCPLYNFSIIDERQMLTANEKQNAFIKKEYRTFTVNNSILLKNEDFIFDYGDKNYDENYVIGTIESQDLVLRGPSFENNSVLRYWHEVKKEDIYPLEDSNAKWVFCSRNGEKTRWYSFSNEIVKKSTLSTASNYESQNETGVLWNDSRFGNPTIIGKEKAKNESFESALNLIICNKTDRLMYLALFNTGFYEEILKTRINGQHFSPIYIKKLVKFKANDDVIDSVEAILDIHRKYIKLFEESYFFESNLLTSGTTIKKTFEILCKDIKAYKENILLLEERIVNIVSSFIKTRSNSRSKMFVYEFTPMEYIKRLLSYLVGVALGRYSLDDNGLAYAGGKWDAMKYQTYVPDDDGIIPIYSTLGMEDSLTARIIELIRKVFGEQFYRDNIDFIADALGKKQSESSEETLNRYLNEDFYNDHLKMYQKRPIFWMFSSGKNSGFKCLVYLHRYNKETLARINGKYFLPESTRLKNELDEINASIGSMEGRERVNKEKERQKLSEKYNEAIEYGQILDHMANRFLDIDLDDGVKENYKLFQGIEVVSDNGTKIKKDLLVPIK